MSQIQRHKIKTETNVVQQSDNACLVVHRLGSRKTIEDTGNELNK